MKTATEPTNGRSRQGRKSRRLSTRIRVAIPLATAAAALSVASTAWACTYFSGQTYFDNPATTTLDQGLEKSVSSRSTTNLRIWGKGVPASENYPTSPWKVVASPFGQCCGSGTTRLDPNNYTFKQYPSPSVAQLGPTTNATVSGKLGRGTFSVCWLYGDETGKALNPATLTVTN